MAHSAHAVHMVDVSMGVPRCHGENDTIRLPGWPKIGMSEEYMCTDGPADQVRGNRALEHSLPIPMALVNKLCCF